MTNVVLTLDAAGIEHARNVLSRAGFTFETRPNTAYLARGRDATVTAYHTGKVLVTGPGATSVANLLAPASAPAPGARGLERPADGVGSPTSAFTPHIGSDETGKGDYFGPLVVAACAVPDGATARRLLRAGVRDSKDVTDDEAERLAALLASDLPHAVVTLAPPQYNDVYATDPNLNRVLARLHTDAVKQVAGKARGITQVVVDRFAAGRPVAVGLRRAGLDLDVKEEARAEHRHIAVAAASLLARAAFLQGLRAMEKQYNGRLPKGAGAPVPRAGRAFVSRHGAEALKNVAKLHFVTTKRILRNG